MTASAAPALFPPPPAAAATPRHLPQLDALRGIAALMVLSFHLYGETYHWTFVPPHTVWDDLRQHPSLARWLGAPASLGDAGVPLFFVLSGFCIHYALLRSDRPFAYGRFMWKRFWRIYPAYVVALGVALLLREHPLAPVPHWHKTLLLHLTMLHNISTSTMFEWNPACWTLAIEFQFYAAYPVFLWLRGRLGTGRAVGLLGVIAVALLTMFSATGISSPKWVEMPLVSWVQWGLGAWLAERLVDGRPALLRARWVLPVCGGLVLLLARTNPWAWSMLVWAIAWAAVMEAWTRTDGRGVPRALVGIGVISYSVYLLHQPLILRLLSTMPDNLDLRFARIVLIAPPLVLAMAACSYFLVERPGIWIGHRVGPAPRRR